jgi:hypothetical protein
VAKLKFGNWSSMLIYLSGVAVVLAGVGYMYQDIWLASTQWLLVAAILALFGLYFKAK